MRPVDTLFYQMFTTGDARTQAPVCGASRRVTKMGRGAVQRLRVGGFLNDLDSDEKAQICDGTSERGITKMARWSEKVTKVLDE